MYTKAWLVFSDISANKFASSLESPTPGLSTKNNFLPDVIHSKVPSTGILVNSVCMLHTVLEKYITDIYRGPSEQNTKQYGKLVMNAW